MSEENKKPKSGFSIDDDDVDALLGIIHHRKDEPRPAQKPSGASQPSATPASEHNNAPSPSFNGTASEPSSPPAETKHGGENNVPDKESTARRHTPSIPSSGGHSVGGSSSNGTTRSGSASTSAGSAHTNQTASRPRVVDFDEVDPEGGKRRRRKKLRKNAATGKSAAVGVFKVVFYIAAVAAVSIFLATNIIRIGNDMFAFVKDNIHTTVSIPDGSTTKEVAQLLKENGIIDYPGIFSLYADRKIKGSSYYTGKYKSGAIRFVFENEKSDKTDTPVQAVAENANAEAYSDYVADSDNSRQNSLPMSYSRILSLVAESDYKVRDSVRITIPEGYTVDEILDLLIENGVGERDKYIDAIQNYEYDYRFVKALDDAPQKDGRTYRLEGYLFPDTYDFFTDESEISVINKLLSNFDAKMENVYYERADELGMSVDDVIIIASIIEKEARLASDLPIMSSVFHNRLDKGMYLNSDATVMYALPERKKSLSSADLETDSPYNTYKRIGLTPGAISNPGIEAINAAFYPDKTDYYYFFSLKDGSTVYSVNYDQHTSKLNKAIAEGTLAS